MVAQFLKVIVKLIVVFGLFYLIFRNINFRDFLLVIQNGNAAYFYGIFILWIISMVFISIRWSIILNEYAIPIPLKRTIDITWIASFMNNFLPAGVGGDSYRWLYLNKSIKNKKILIISSIMIDRAIGLAAIFVALFVFGVPYIGFIIGNTLLSVTYAISIIITVIGLLYLLILPDLRVQKIFNLPALNSIVHTFNTLLSIKSRWVLVEALLLSIVTVFIAAIATYLNFLAFSYQIPLSLILYLVPVITLSELIPLSINSLGIKEGAAIYLFSLFQVPGEIVLSVFLINRIILTLFTITGGFRYITLKHNFSRTVHL